MGIVHAQIAADIRSQLRKKGSTALPLAPVVFCKRLANAHQNRCPQFGQFAQSPDLIKTVGLASSCRIFDAHVFAARRVLARFEQFVTVYRCAGWS